MSGGGKGFSLSRSASIEPAPPDDEGGKVPITKTVEIGTINIAKDAAEDASDSSVAQEEKVAGGVKEDGPTKESASPPPSPTLRSNSLGTEKDRKSPQHSPRRGPSVKDGLGTSTITAAPSFSHTAGIVAAPVAPSLRMGSQRSLQHMISRPPSLNTKELAPYVAKGNPHGSGSSNSLNSSDSSSLNASNNGGLGAAQALSPTAGKQGSNLREDPFDAALSSLYDAPNTMGNVSPPTPYHHHRGSMNTTPTMRSPAARRHSRYAQQSIEELMQRGASQQVRPVRCDARPFQMIILYIYYIYYIWY
jgi:hypothetical protein